MKKASVLIQIMRLPLIAAFDHAYEVSLPRDARCGQCGMICSLDSPFTALIEKSDGSRRPFCDIGDLMVYVQEQKGEKPGKPPARDIHSHEFLDAEKRFYIKGRKFRSPVGWNIAAFRKKEGALEYGNPANSAEVLGSLP